MNASFLAISKGHQKGMEAALTLRGSVLLCEEKKRRADPERSRKRVCRNKQLGATNRDQPADHTPAALWSRGLLFLQTCALDRANGPMPSHNRHAHSGIRRQTGELDRVAPSCPVPHNLCLGMPTHGSGDS